MNDPTTDLDDFRAAKDEYFGRAPDSPIRAEDRPGFDGLDYYEAVPALRFELEPMAADGAPITVQTSDGQERVYTREATVSFSVDGADTTLTLYGTSHSSGYFVPFRDATSGSETYGAGRYLDLEPPHDGRVTIDFNLAYNPYCAYNDAYSCPLPPGENWLTVPIRAGEKDYRPGS